MKKLVILTLLCLLSHAILGAEVSQRDLENNLLRMHIIADSNLPEAQKIKLDVRDAILEESHKNADWVSLERAAREELSKSGAPYSLKTSFKRCYVPEKRYKNLHLPEGVYNCFQVVLGRGEGENWWCVAYPPLCFSESVLGEVSEDGKKQLEKLLDKNTLKMIVDSGEVNLRFKIAEDMKKLIACLNSK